MSIRGRRHGDLCHRSSRRRFKAGESQYTQKIFLIHRVVVVVVVIIVVSIIIPLRIRNYEGGLYIQWKSELCFSDDR